MAWLPASEKKFVDMFIRFDRMYERDGRTDGRTGRHRITAKLAAAVGRMQRDVKRRVQCVHL